MQKRQKTKKPPQPAENPKNRFNKKAGIFTGFFYIHAALFFCRTTCVSVKQQAGCFPACRVLSRVENY
ncbi:MAG: hypothetical protein EA357_03135 [Micavibrio sp.]|nr:MAG: hypothetical protein EA357_03135 [Micavibrio sp.]